MNTGRILPPAIAAVGLLLALKATGLITTGHFALAAGGAAPAGGHGAAPAPASGGHGAEPAAGQATVGAPSPPPPIPPKSGGVTVNLQPSPPPGDTAILEQLAERRKQLDRRQAELDQREALINAAEKRVTQRIGELQTLEADINQKSQADQAAEVAQLKSLAAMYESMKPADAAHIFDRLDLAVLTGLARAIKPQKMAAILSLMTADTAHKLTLELAGAGTAASRAGAAGGDISKLPKIGENGLTQAR